MSGTLVEAARDGLEHVRMPEIPLGGAQDTTLQVVHETLGAGRARASASTPWTRRIRGACCTSR